MRRRKEAKSVTEINFVNSGDEHESIVGRHCHADNETDLDAKTPRRIDAWSVSKKSFDCFAAVLNYNQLDSFGLKKSHSR